MMSTTSAQENAISQFISFTRSTPEVAVLYLRMVHGDVQEAVEIFRSNAHSSRDPSHSALSSLSQPSEAVTPPPHHRRQVSHGQLGYEDSNGVIHLDPGTDVSDDELEFLFSTPVTPENVKYGSKKSCEITCRDLYCE